MAEDVFFGEPYINRQMVLFVDDAILAGQEQSTTITTTDLTNTKKRISSRDIADSLLDGLIAGVAASAASIAIVLGKALADTLLSYREAKNEGVENLRLVGKSKIPHFQLPPGHPRVGIVYV